MLLGEIVMIAGFLAHQASASFVITEDFPQTLNDHLGDVYELGGNVCPATGSADMMATMNDLLTFTIPTIQAEKDFRVPFTVNCSLYFTTALNEINCDTEYVNVKEHYEGEGTLSPQDAHRLHEGNVLKTMITVGLGPEKHPIAQYWLHHQFTATKTADTMSLSASHAKTPSDTTSLSQTGTHEPTHTRSMVESKTLSKSQSKTLTSWPFPSCGLASGCAYTVAANQFLTWQLQVSSQMSRNDAVSYCQGLGSGWRLRTLWRDLNVLYQQSSILGNNNIKAMFWASDFYYGPMGNTWYNAINFNGGATGGYAESRNFYVRCVRG